MCVFKQFKDIYLVLLGTYVFKKWLRSAILERKLPIVNAFSLRICHYYMINDLFQLTKCDSKTISNKSNVI